MTTLRQPQDGRDWLRALKFSQNSRILERMSLTYPFFSTDTEVIALWRFISAIPGMRLLEAASRPDKPLRTFDRFPESEWRDPEHFFSLVAWPSQISSTPSASWIEFSKGGREWAEGTGCTRLESPAFFRIASVDAPNANLVGFNELVFESLASASRRFSETQIAAMNWIAMGKLIREIKKHIQRSAAGKWRSIPVSPGVADILSAEVRQLWFWGHEGTI